jgi:hypothetical protein
MKIALRVLLWGTLALAMTAAVGLWSLSVLRPRPRPEGAVEKALAGGSVDELRRVLAVHPADVEDAYGFTPLDWAARNGQTDAIRELVRAGADPDGRDHGPNGWTPLEHAVHKGQLGAVRALIAAGAHVDAGSSRKGLTPLMLAAAQGEGEIVDALLAAGADPHAEQAGEETTLTYAMTSGNRRVILALLRTAPDLRLSHSWKGRVARLLARVRGQSDILAMLRHPPRPRMEAAR